MEESKFASYLKRKETKNKLFSNFKKGNVAVFLLDKLIAFSIYAVLFLIPLFFTNSVTQGLAFDKMMLFYLLSFLGVAAWIIKGIILGELEIKRTPLDIPLLILLVLYFVSSVLSVSFKESMLGAYGDTTKGFVSLVVFVLFYYFVVNNINQNKLKIAFFTFLSSILLLSVYSILQLFNIYILPWSFAKQPSFNSIGSLTGLSVVLTMTLPLLLLSLTNFDDILQNLSGKKALIIKILLGISLVLTSVLLALLNLFTYWSVAIMGIVILLLFYLSKVIKISNNKLAIPLIVFLFLIIFLVIGKFNFLDTSLPVEVSLSRSVSWNIAKDGLKDFSQLLFGSGPSTFYYDFSKYKEVSFNSSPLWNVRFNSASGLLFELVSTVGVLGVLSIIAIMLILLSTGYLSLVKKTDQGSRAILLAFSSGLLVMAVVSMLFTVNNTVIIIGVLFGILIIASTVVISPESYKTFKLSFRSDPKYALALAAAFLAVSAGVVILATLGGKLYLADIYAKRSVVAIKTEEKIEYLAKAIQLAPYEDSYYLEAANHYMNMANQEAMNRTPNNTKIESYLKSALENGKKAYELNPNKAGIVEALALIYENAAFYVSDSLQLAEDYYNKLAELDPNNPISSLRIGLINMAKSNKETDEQEKKVFIEEAIKKYDEALSKKVDLSSAYYGKAIAFERLNDLDKSIEALKNAATIENTNLDYRFELGRMLYNRGVTVPVISQSADEEILTDGEKPENDLSVSSEEATAGKIKKNDDLALAEQLFLSILQQNPKHLNSLYSLAMLYQKTGETEKAKIAVTSLLSNITDEETKKALQEQFQGLY